MRMKEKRKQRWRFLEWFQIGFQARSERKIKNKNPISTLHTSSSQVKREKTHVKTHIIHHQCKMSRKIAA